MRPDETTPTLAQGLGVCALVAAVLVAAAGIATYLIEGYGVEIDETGYFWVSQHRCLTATYDARVEHMLADGKITRAEYNSFMADVQADDLAAARDSVAKRRLHTPRVCSQTV